MKQVASGFLISIVFWVLLLLALEAFAAHSIHNWQLYDTAQASTGRTVCSWVCENLNQPHTTVTYGHGGQCPRPW